MKKDNMLNNIIEESLKNNAHIAEADIEVTPLSDIMNQIRKKRQKRINRFILKPVLFVVLFVSITFIAGVFSDNPQVKALKYKLFKMEYSIEGGNFNLKINNKDNYKIIQNDDNILKIEFYDINSAKERIDVQFYYANYIPENYRIKTIIWEKDMPDLNVIKISYEDINNNILKIDYKYLLEDEDLAGAINDDFKKEIDIKDDKGLLFEKIKYSFHRLVFIHDNIHIDIYGQISEEDIIKVATSMFD